MLVIVHNWDSVFYSLKRRKIPFFVHETAYGLLLTHFFYSCSDDLLKFSGTCLPHNSINENLIDLHLTCHASMVFWWPFPTSIPPPKTVTSDQFLNNELRFIVRAGTSINGHFPGVHNRSDQSPVDGGCTTLFLRNPTCRMFSLSAICFIRVNPNRFYQSREEILQNRPNPMEIDRVCPVNFTSYFDWKFQS